MPNLVLNVINKLVLKAIKRIFFIILFCYSIFIVIDSSQAKVRNYIDCDNDTVEFIVDPVGFRYIQMTFINQSQHVVAIGNSYILEYHYANRWKVEERGKISSYKAESYLLPGDTTQQMLDLSIRDRKFMSGEYRIIKWTRVRGKKQFIISDKFYMDEKRFKEGSLIMEVDSIILD